LLNEAVESVWNLREGHQVIQAVIFDMDGLLVDSEPVWFEARRVLFRRHGKIWTDADQEQLMGVRTSVWVDYVTKKLEGAMRPDEVLEETLDLMASAYEGGNVPVLPGASEALQHCTGKYRVGLASGSPKRLIDAALRGADWFRFFEEIISSDECAHGKPEPDVYLEIMKRMGLDPATTAVVEDSIAGVRAGLAARSKVVAVPRGFTPRNDEALLHADARLKTLHELPSVLERL
jgi:HAD superfamily hydrolase (TIGR01509 family)